MENKFERYARLQNESGFKEGDSVKVIGPAVHGQFGWECSWADQMTNAIEDGFVYTITCMRRDVGCELTGKGVANSYWFPFFCLEQVPPEPTEEVETGDSEEDYELTGPDPLDLDAEEKPAKPAAVFRFD